MDFQIPSILVVADPTQTAFPIVTRGTETLATQEFGMFDSTTFKSVTSPSFPTNQSIFIAQGSGRTDLGTFKSAKIFPKNITGWYGTKGICTSLQQITYVGYNEVEDTYSMSAACDEQFSVTIRVFGERVRHLNPMGLTKSYLLQSACCTDCSTGCDSVDCNGLADSLVEQINSDTYMNKWVVAEKVTKCSGGSPATTVFALTVPDPGTNVGGVDTVSFTNAGGAAPYTASTTTLAVTGTASASGINAQFTIVTDGTGAISSVTCTTPGTLYIMGETIVIAGTAIAGGATPGENITLTVAATTGAEGALLSDIQTLYAAYVTDALTDIVVTADTDADQDSNSLGNIRIELTPATGVVLADLPVYYGVSWQEITLAASTETCICGVKITGLALDEFGNACVPTAFPHTFDSVRFAVYTNKGTETTSDYEVFDPCTAWHVETVQQATYPIGEGEAYRDMEMDSFAYYNKDKQNFINPLYNFGHTLFVDSTKFYDAYTLTYKVERNDNFAALDGQEAKLTVLFEHDCNTNTISTLAALYQAAVNSVANAQGFASVSL